MRLSSLALVEVDDASCSTTSSSAIDPAKHKQVQLTIEVGGICGPGAVGQKDPSGGLVNTKGQCSEAVVGDGQGDNVNEGRNGLVGTKEEGRPDQVEGELHAVGDEGRASGGAGGEHGGAIPGLHQSGSGVAHASVKQSPYGGECSPWGQTRRLDLLGVPLVPLAC